MTLSAYIGGVRVRPNDRDTFTIQAPPERHAHRVSRDMAVAITGELNASLESRAGSFEISYPSGLERIAADDARLLLFVLRQRLGILHHAPTVK